MTERAVGTVLVPYVDLSGPHTEIADEHVTAAERVPCPMSSSSAW